MVNFKGLIYTMDAQKYLDYDNEIANDFLITNVFDECITVSSIYRFRYIFIDETSASDVINLIEGCELDHQDAISPYITVANHKNILKRLIEIREQNKFDDFDLMPQKIDTYLDTLMLNLNISPKVKGYVYIKHVLAIGMLDDTALLNLRQNLYCDIAKIFKTTQLSVERAICFSIKKAFKDNPCERLNNIFENCDKIPSNCIFLKKLLIVAKANIKEYIL